MAGIKPPHLDVSAISATGGNTRPLSQPRDAWGLVALPIILFLFVFFAYPTGLTLLRAFTHFDAPEVGGLDNITWVLGGAANRTILIRTFTVALLCTVFAALLAFPYAYLMTKVNSRWQTVMMGLLLVSMFFGILLRNFSWVVLLQMQGPVNDLIAALGFDRVRMLGTAPAVLMGMTHVLFPFMALPLYAVLKGIDPRLVLAAQSLGATPRNAFLQVYLPLALPGLFAGALLVFVLALGFYITPAILGSPKQALISQVLYQQFETRAAFGRAGALAIVLLIAAMAFVLMANAVQKRNKAYEG
jgi:putative spermidine/putrescine transport system permease protein